MSPRPADPAIRLALLETAARIIAEEGTAGLTLRRLAREVGTSTIAVYTYFGSMEEVRRAVRREGFARLAAHLGAVPPSSDPVADLILLGEAYYRSAMESPNLYRAMFLDGPVDADDAATGTETFLPLVDCIARCIAAGRFDPADPPVLARGLWALTHGVVSLQLAGLLDEEEAVACRREAGRRLLVGFGADPAGLVAAAAKASRRSRAIG